MSTLKNRSKVHSLMARLALGLSLLTGIASDGGCGRPDAPAPYGKALAHFQTSDFHFYIVP